MGSLILWIIIFLVSLFILLKSSQYFTLSAERIGIVLGIPAFIVGVTIVSIGTSLPELVSSVIAVLQGSSEIVGGNVLGSNITNVFLVLGAAAVTGRKLEIDYEVIHVDLPLFAGSAFLLAFMIWDGVYTKPEAVISIIGFIIYTLYLVNFEKETHPDDDPDGKGLEKKTILTLILSSALIYLSARYTVESVIEISEILKVGKEVIAASAVALGTSLPELVVSTTAARQGKPELAIGNILGSNIFNAFTVMGVSALFGNILIPRSMLTFPLPLMLGATVLYVFITQDKEITKWEGSMLILFYVYYLGRLFNIM